MTPINENTFTDQLTGRLEEIISYDAPALILTNLPFDTRSGYLIPTNENISDTNHGTVRPEESISTHTIAPKLTNLPVDLKSVTPITTNEHIPDTDRHTGRPEENSSTHTANLPVEDDKKDKNCALGENKHTQQADHRAMPMAKHILWADWLMNQIQHAAILSLCDRTGVHFGGKI